MTNTGENRGKLPHRFQEIFTRTLFGSGVVTSQGNRQRWLSVILLFIVLEIAVLSIERAQWIMPQPPLTLILIFSMITTWLLCKSRIPGLVKHLGVLIIGGLVTIWQATSVAGFGQSTIYFAIFIVFLVWITGYISTWYFFQKQNAWAAVILGTVAILVNLSNLPDKYYLFFGFYFVAALIFIVQNRISRYHYLPGSSSKNRSRGLLYFIAVPVCISVLAVSVAWVTPEVSVPQLESLIATNTLWTHDVKESSFNFFAHVMAKQPKTTSTARRSLQFGKQWHQGDQVYFIVNADRPLYWQVHVYDTYTSWGWTNSPTSRHVLDKGSVWEGTESYSKQTAITYIVETMLKTDVLLTAGEINSSDTAVLVHVGAGDVIAVTTPRLLKPEESYTITSATSSASPQDLSEAGGDYPQNIKDNYLQLPPDLPDSIRILSENITRNAITPYDRVLAIDEYLAKIPYEEEIEAPPEGVDGVEHFLMTQKSGFCTYFASAMAVMLRSVDVPSRLVVGYLPGDRGENDGEYILRDKHYHAWPQAYFPGYGWVNLEATPGNAESPVALETPWVSSDTIRQQEQQADMQWLDALYYYQMNWGWNTSSITEPIERVNPRWAYADILGKTLVWILGAALVILLLTGLLLTFRSGFYRWLWRVVRTDQANVVYSRLCALGNLAKLGPEPQQTPLEYTASLTSEFPEHSEKINDITRIYVENRFGRKSGRLGLMEEAELLKARHDVYNAILERLGFFRKILRK